MTEGVQVALIGAGATLGAALIGVGAIIWQTQKTLAAGRAQPNASTAAGSAGTTLLPPESGNEGILWRHDAQVSSDVLIVLVHGLNGDANGSWDDLPRHLQTRLQPHGRADVFSFAYGAGMFQRASIDEAAKALQTFLQNLPRPYRHIFLVTHSAGGLVARRAVIREFDRILEIANCPEAGDDSTRNLDVAESFVFRIRRLNSIAVPHWGGTIPFSMLLVPFYLFLPVMLVQERILRLFGWCWKKLRRRKELRPGYEQRQQWGWNQIPWQLRHHNTDLAALRASWQAQRKCAKRKVFAFPDSWEITGSFDHVIANESASVDASGPSPRSAMLLSGTHVLVNKTTSANDSLITKLTEPMLPLFARHFSVLVAYETAHRTVEFSARATLIGSEEKPPAGSQREAFNRLRNFLQHHAEGPTLAALVGDTGTGKSMVLRTVSRDCCNHFLGGTPGQGREVLHLPLEIHRKFSNDIARSPDLLWRALQERWLAHSSGIAGLTLSLDWMEDVLRRRPCLLVLDSVDEFLLNNPNVAQSVFLEMMRHLREEHAGNAQLRILGGARLTHPVHKELSNIADVRVEITHLERGQIEQYFPLTYRFFAEDGSRPLDQTTIELLTPLVLDAIEDYLRIEVRDRTSLAAWEHDLELRDPVHGYGLLEVAIHATLRKAGMHTMGAGSGAIADYYLALAMLAMVYAQEFASELTDAEITTGVAEISARLAPVLAAQADRPIACRADTALRLLREPASRKRLLACSLFFPTRKLTAEGTTEESFRFKHREWHDSLLGRYFALCFQIPVLGELREVAFLQRSQRIGGEILCQLKPEKWLAIPASKTREDFGLDVEFADQLVAAMQQADGHFILGNFGGLIGNAPIPITDAALTRLLQDRDLMPGGGKLVFFAGLGHRIMRQFPADPSWQMLRDRSGEVFRPQLDPAACRQAASSPGNERVIASVSWCYLREFAMLWPNVMQPPEGPWPGLCANDEERWQVVDRLHAALVARNPYRFARPADVYRNCQFAFAYVQPEALRHPDSRPISVVHYLYTLALTAYADVLIPETHAHLEPVIATGGLHEALYRNHRITELEEIFKESRRLLGAVI